MTAAPAALSIAHMIVATFGLNALVVTAVAIELGPSVQPLTKTTPKLMMRATYAHGWALHSWKNSEIVIHNNITRAHEKLI